MEHFQARTDLHAVEVNFTPSPRRYSPLFLFKRFVDLLFKCSPEAQLHLIVPYALQWGGELTLFYVWKRFFPDLTVVLRLSQVRGSHVCGFFLDYVFALLR